jgi:hypothetical protein
MKQQDMLPAPISSTFNGNGHEDPSLSTYHQAGLYDPWVRQFPGGVRFMPIEGFSSPFQIMEIKRSFEIKMSQHAYNTMMGYVLNAPGEVSGFGKVVRDGSCFTVENIVALAEYNTEGSSLITEKTLYRFMRQMRKHGLTTEGYDLWWHSHNTMGVFFSGVDQAAIEGPLKNPRFTLSIVANKRLETRCRVDFYDPVRYGVDQLPLKIVPSVDADMAAQLAKDLDKMRHGRHR